MVRSTPWCPCSWWSSISTSWCNSDGNTTCSTSSPPFERKTLQCKTPSFLSNRLHRRSRFTTALGSCLRSLELGGTPHLQNLNTSPMTGSSSCNNCVSTASKFSYQAVQRSHQLGETLYKMPITGKTQERPELCHPRRALPLLHCLYLAWICRHPFALLCITYPR